MTPPLLLLLPLLLTAAAAPSPKLLASTHAGTGCPSTTTATVSLTPAGLTATIPTRAFTATAGTPRVFCQLAVQIDPGAGQQFRVAAGTYEGEMELPAGARGVHVSLYYFSGETQQTGGRAEFAGVRKGRWEREETVRGEWSACGEVETLNVKSDVRVRGGGWVRGSVDGEARVEVGLEWRKC